MKTVIHHYIAKGENIERKKVKNALNTRELVTKKSSLLLPIQYFLGKILYRLKSEEEY